MSDSPTPDQVRLDEELHRFVLEVADGTAFIDVRETPDGEVALIHTEVPGDLEGRGVGTVLVAGALGLLRERKARVLPYCPFVHAYIRRHPDQLDLVSERYPWRDRLTR